MWTTDLGSWKSLGWLGQANFIAFQYKWNVFMFNVSYFLLQSVVKSTSAWVNDFVVKYDLCPFAEKVFTDQSIRYRIFFGTNEEQIKAKLRYEVRIYLTLFILKKKLLNSASTRSWRFWRRKKKKYLPPCWYSPSLLQVLRLKYF